MPVAAFVSPQARERAEAERALSRAEKRKETLRERMPFWVHPRHHESYVNCAFMFSEAAARAHVKQQMRAAGLEVRGGGMVVPIRREDVWDGLRREANAIVGHNGGGEPPRAIIARIAREHELTFEQVVSDQRARPILAARYAAIRAVHAAYPKFSNGQIGQFFGGRDPSTIHHALKKHG